jgi:hypothetical protein
VVEIPVTTLRKPTKPPTPLARAHARALAQTLLDLYKMNYPDKEVIESFKRAVLKIWKLRYEYYKDEPEFQELVELGLLPPRP